MKSHLLLSAILLTAAELTAATAAPDSIPPGRGIASYSATAKTSGQKLCMTMDWDRSAPGTYTRATAEIDLSDSDNIYGCAGRLSICRYSDSTRTVLSETTFTDPTPDRCFTLRLHRAHTGYRLLAGSGQPIVELDVDCNRGLPVSSSATGRSQIISSTLRTEPWVEATFAQYPDTDSLMTRLNASTDRLEGCWTYLDRDTDYRLTTLGGDYTLACVANGSGYDLIYLAGAKANADEWLPLRIKGHLEPTRFIDHYSLVWYDPWGYPLDRETTATLTDGSILTLNLPLYSATIRLQRALPAQH